MSQEFKNISADKFQFAHNEEKIYDKKFETKPIGYFKDAWIRFKRNKASLIAALIILAIALFGIVAPFVSNYDISESDGVYAKARPRIEFLSFIPLFDGGYDLNLNDKYYMYLMGIGMGAADTHGTGVTWEEAESSEFNPLMKIGAETTIGGKVYRNARIESYHSVGFKYLSINMKEYEKIKAWEQESGIQVLYPMVDVNNQWTDSNNASDANFWYRHAANSSPVDKNGKKMDLADVLEKGLVDNYLRDAEGNVLDYAKKDKSMIQVRALYYNYYIYKNGHEPVYSFGSDAQGYDILVRMASGIRLSLILAFSVAFINLTIGTIYGSIEGYYGGWIDLFLERISDIFSNIPMVVLFSLVQINLVLTGKMSTLEGMLLAFLLTGWIGTAYRVRTQFYRYKNQEYVLAARTLGAGDARLMFKHIFPNALGTIITSSILTIPGVIFTESSLAYLGIVNFNSKNLTSLGTMLSNGQGYLSTDPHIILFPALVLSLLMISFNLFGNGLRDAFNPSLRGADE